ncbi:cation:proton antiporter [Nonomuraea sp. NPDC048901]|uniref:cation:proton antiporter domain-containing protein n=1 Tax=Nonomuraea sp. NPDC048901 TaxID=3155627 RepID=UPI0033DA7EBF
MSADQTFEHLCVALVLIWVTAAVLARAAARIGQPPVLGEILAGILLGPVALGRVAPGLRTWLLPAEISPYLAVLASIGLALYLGALAYGLDPSPLVGRAGLIARVAAGSFGLPLALGFGVGVVLLVRSPVSSTAGAHPAAFVLFIGVALATTAIPVLVRILVDLRITETVPAMVGIAGATATDVPAWILLGIAAAFAQPGLSSWTAVLTAGGVMLVGLIVVRKVLRGRVGRFLRDLDTGPAAALVLLGAVGSVALGLHVVFGALCAGAILPRRDDGTCDERILAPMRTVGNALIPIFFVVSGASMDLTALPAGGLAWLGLILPVAIVGKVGGGYLGSRLAGLHRKDALIVGVLLNTRGLTEIVVLSVGLQVGLLTKGMYSMFVLMALITTALTGPLLGRLMRGTPREPVPAVPIADLDVRELKALMSMFPTGVAVVTTLDGKGVPHGLTCSSLSSLSLEPPLLLVCVHNRSGTLAALRDSGAFAVNLLHHEGGEAAEAFAGGGRFTAVDWRPGELWSTPVLTGHDAHAAAECALHRLIPMGDHTIVVGRVARITVLRPAAVPLVYGQRRYAAWPRSATADKSADQ